MPSAAAIVDSYLACLRSGDFSQAPLSSRVRYENPLMGFPVEGKHNMIRFLQNYAKVLEKVQVVRHVVDGEYVATLVEMASRFGQLTVVQMYRVEDGLITEARSFFDPREILENMGTYTVD